MQVQTLPSWFQLDITNRCNFACKMCPRKQMSLDADQMTMDVYIEIIDKINANKVDMLSLTGMGEPLLHENILDMIEIAKKCNIPVSITTNGTLLNKKMADNLMALNLDYLRVSVDQITNLNNDELHPYSKKVLENIISMVQSRKEAANNTPTINLITVLTRGNMFHVNKIIRWAKNNGVDYIQLMKLSTRVNMLKGLPLFAEEMLFRWYHDYANKISFDLRSNYTRKTDTDCSFLNNYLFILSNGDVSPCCHLRKYIVGNVLNSSIEEIWNGSKLAFFRENWSKICGGCNLMMWNHKKLKKGAPGVHG